MAQADRCRRRPAAERSCEPGEVMVTAVVLIAALLLSSTILVSASEQWEARRKAAAAAATMARAAAQADVSSIRASRPGIDPDIAVRRLDEVVSALNAADRNTTYTGAVTAIEGDVVATRATVTVAYTFPLPGFPSQIEGTARARAVRGFDG